MFVHKLHLAIKKLTMKTYYQLNILSFFFYNNMILNVCPLCADLSLNVSREDNYTIIKLTMIINLMIGDVSATETSLNYKS